MVLNELGQKISQALSMIQNAESIDEKVRTALLICNPSLSSAVTPGISLKRALRVERKNAGFVQC